MSDDQERNSTVNATAVTNIHHAQLQNLLLDVARRLYKGGI
jgi:putative IMPACT (imprinted ancient) family translation regulator